MCLADEMYYAQRMCIDDILAGLSDDIHWFDVLKSRQLGISTLMRALSLFWLGIHDGLKGYSILDTDGHKEEGRLEIIFMIENLPRSLGFPGIRRKNRYLIELENGSLLNFATGGVKKGRGSGTLGRSSGVNFAHISEMCSIDNPEGIEAFKNSLAEDFENRLYLWESTARGFNQRHEMWVEAQNDPAHKKCIFIGWWAKDNQFIHPDSPDWAKYGVPEPTRDEIKKIEQVYNLYGFKVTQEQLAWYRRKVDPGAMADQDGNYEFKGGVLQIQEQPWTAEDAYQHTGAVFFQPTDLTDISNSHVSKQYERFSFSTGMDFIDVRVYPAHNARSVELKVWEEPVDDGVYVIATDSAYGRNPKNDRSVIQVLRCYADGMDQVAEYAWPLVNARQFAWITAAIMGWYGASEKAQIYFILEFNGPGEAVWEELVSLKRQVAIGYQPKDSADLMGLRRVFYNVRNYMTSRSDAVTPNYNNYHLKTSRSNKLPLMERLRDFVSNGSIRIRSAETVEEMKSIQREGDTVAAQGSKKDDRVISLAFAVRCWEERVRPLLLSGRRTREAERAKTRVTMVDQVALWNKNTFGTYLDGKARNRQMTRQQQARAMWRHRP